MRRLSGATRLSRSKMRLSGWAWVPRPLARATWPIRFRCFEVPLAKVVADLSLVGLIAYLWLFGTLCLTSFRAQARASRAGAASTASLLAAILVYQMLATIGGYELAIDALPVWFLSGAAASLAATVADPPEAGRSPVARGRAPMHGASQ